MKEGNQNDCVDAQTLAELLQHNQLRPVYHGDHGLRAQKELVRSYLTISKDLIRVMTRVKAIYRSWGIATNGTQVYSARHRVEWLEKIRKLWCAGLETALSDTFHGPIRAAVVLLGIVQTAHRFRTKRQLWTYSGLGIEVHSSADHQVVKGQLQRKKKPIAIHGLNKNYNRL